MLSFARALPRTVALTRPAAAIGQTALRSATCSVRCFERAAPQPSTAPLAKFAALQSRFFSSPGDERLPDDQRKIFVGNLAWRVSSEDLHSHFQQWGKIEDARVIMDKENPFRSRGFGFVTFSRPEDAQTNIFKKYDEPDTSECLHAEPDTCEHLPEDAQTAVEKNNEQEWQGRNITVNLASAGNKNSPARPPRTSY